jgi:hypothetical protein
MFRGFKRRSVWQCNREKICAYEKDLSAQSTEEKKTPRIFKAHANQNRPQCAGEAQSKRPQKAQRYLILEIC